MCVHECQWCFSLDTMFTATGLDRQLTNVCALWTVFSYPEDWTSPEDHEILRMGLASDIRCGNSKVEGPELGMAWHRGAGPGCGTRTLKPTKAAGTRKSGIWRLPHPRPCASRGGAPRHRSAPLAGLQSTDTRQTSDHVAARTSRIVASRPVGPK